MKKLLKDRMLLTAVLSFVLALLAMIAVGYAWFTNANRAKAGNFVLPVGTMGISYDFGHVVGSTVNETDQILIDKVVPGRNHYFYLAVTNVSEDPGEVDIYFHEVSSWLNLAGGLSEDFTGIEEQKIQYAYEYSLIKLYWNSDGQSVDVLTSLDEDYPIPDNSQLEAWNWIEEDNLSQFTAKSHEYNPNGQHFSLMQDGLDREDYYIIEDLILEEKGSQYSSFVLVFEVRFTQAAVLPDTMGAIEIPHSNVYENQQLWVENIVIKAGEEQ